MEVILIVAVEGNGGIGYKGGLPWPRLKEDMAHFRKQTTGHVVIMGRRTFESLGSKPLPNRRNIVMSRNPVHEFTLPAGVEGGMTLETVLRQLELERVPKVFIIGGAVLYTEGFKYVDTMMLTRLNHSYPADTWLHNMWLDNMAAWVEVRDETFNSAELGHTYTMLEFSKTKDTP